MTPIPPFAEWRFTGLRLEGITSGFFLLCCLAALFFGAVSLLVVALPPGNWRAEPERRVLRYLTVGAGTIAVALWLDNSTRERQ
jgi:hypothetical protein